MADVTVTDARRRFGRLLKTAQGEDVKILRRGKVAAFVISAAQFQKLVAAKLAREADASGPVSDARD